jgi:biopolymer transport protein ExbB/TolQ
MNWFVMFADFYKNGGPFMHLILLTAVAILALTAERFWVIGRAASLNAGKLIRDLMQRVTKGDVAGAADLCRKVKGPVATVALAILSRNDSDEEKLQNAADGAAMVVLPRLSRRLPYLSMLANTATLLGLLGTVFGLITAFSAVDAADPAQRSAFLAIGISQALNTTAFGLLVAVPTLLIHGFLVSKVESVVERADEAAVRLIPTLCGKRAAGGKGDGPKSRMAGLLETQEV